MSYWSGNGGEITVGAITLPIKKWTLRKKAKLVENTTSSHAASNYEKVIPDYEWTIEFPWDDTKLPDTDVGLNEGDKGTITFNYGASTKFAVLTGTSVETLEEVNDNSDDIIRCTASGKGGTLTRPVT